MLSNKIVCRLLPVLLFALLNLSMAFQNEQNVIKDAKKNETTGRALFDGKTLNGWEIANFGTQGNVCVSDSSIILEMGDGCTGVTWKGKFPKINYQVSLEAMRVDGNDFFCGMTFPVLDEFCTLIIGGWGGTVVGLSSIDGLDASENSTGIMKKFTNNRWYRIRLWVTKQWIKAWIDDRVMVDFERCDEKLSVRPEVLLSRPFGITSWKTTAALRNIYVESDDDSD